jgi:hypothetical protein
MRPMAASTSSVALTSPRRTSSACPVASSHVVSVTPARYPHIAGQASANPPIPAGQTALEAAEPAAGRRPWQQAPAQAPGARVTISCAAHGGLFDLPGGAAGPGLGVLAGPVRPVRRLCRFAEARARLLPHESTYRRHSVSNGTFVIGAMGHGGSTPCGFRRHTAGPPRALTPGYRGWPTTIGVSCSMSCLARTSAIAAGSGGACSPISSPISSR